MGVQGSPQKKLSGWGGGGGGGGAEKHPQHGSPQMKLSALGGGGGEAGDKATHPQHGVELGFSPEEIASMRGLETRGFVWPVTGCRSHRMGGGGLRCQILNILVHPPNLFHLKVPLFPSKPL